MKQTTLCYIKQNGQVLLMHRTKKLHDPNSGKWIGIGGHFEEGETPEGCLLREVKEEAGVVLTSYQYLGVIVFDSDAYETEQMHLFTADAFEGDVDFDCDEGELAWVPVDQVMDLPTWEGDMQFLPYVLKGCDKFLRLHLVYHGDTLVEVRQE